MEIEGNPRFTEEGLPIVTEKVIAEMTEGHLGMNKMMALIHEQVRVMKDENPELYAHLFDTAAHAPDEMISMGINMGMTLTYYLLKKQGEAYKKD